MNTHYSLLGQSNLNEKYCLLLVDASRKWNHIFRAQTLNIFWYCIRTQHTKLVLATKHISIFHISALHRRWQSLFLLAVFVLFAFGAGSFDAISCTFFSVQMACLTLSNGQVCDSVAGAQRCIPRQNRYHQRNRSRQDLVYYVHRAVGFVMTLVGRANSQRPSHFS